MEFRVMEMDLFFSMWDATPPKGTATIGTGQLEYTTGLKHVLEVNEYVVMWRIPWSIKEKDNNLDIS